MENYKEAAVIIWEFRKLIHTHKKNIIWATYNQGKFFERFRERGTYSVGGEGVGGEKGNTKSANWPLFLKSAEQNW